jgi:hypothetical protein
MPGSGAETEPKNKAEKNRQNSKILNKVFKSVQTSILSITSLLS